VTADKEHRPVTDDQEIFEGFRQCLEEGLGRPMPGLKRDQRLVGDLGLDSLDLLDLVFRLERRFKARINPREFENRVKIALADAPLVENGRYTEAALAEFRKAMPCVPEEELGGGLSVSGLFEVFRVQTFINMVSEVLGGGENGPG
jgi:acyl carrier protein